MIATRSDGRPGQKGRQALAGTRVIPLVIEKEAMEEAKKASGCRRRFWLKAASVREQESGRGDHRAARCSTDGSTDKFAPGHPAEAGRNTAVEWSGDMKIIADDAGQEHHGGNQQEWLDQGADLVVCTGGMSVDPDDRTPLAIRNTGARIVSYGAPVLPGAMFLISYMPDGRPVCGLPGCVMYAKRTIFDICLPYLLSDEPITADDLANLGNGGLCLNCPVCVWPNCGFGK